MCCFGTLVHTTNGSRIPVQLVLAITTYIKHPKFLVMYHDHHNFRQPIAHGTTSRIQIDCREGPSIQVTQTLRNTWLIDLMIQATLLEPFNGAL